VQGCIEGIWAIAGFSIPGASNTKESDYRMKVLFIDHVFHKKTRSTNFLLDLLRENFEHVDTEYVDIEGTRHIDALQKARVHDLVVIFQLDFLAIPFLATGIPTVVVPMYDGSANMPHEHWLAMNSASFVNFSRSLHERIGEAGGRSMLLRYFVEPCEEAALPNFDDLRGILWMRRPQDGLTPKYFESLLPDQLATLHVHNAPDDGSPRDLSDPEYRVRSVLLTESGWGSSSDGYRLAMQKCNVFFAPRMSEGIGVAMLEAFASGLLVVANDDSVHNEYVANWANGVLFARDSTGPFALTPQRAKEMAFNGWHGAAAGFDEWKNRREDIVKFIREAVACDRPSNGFNQNFLVALWNAYLLGWDAYRRFLTENVVDSGVVTVNPNISGGLPR